MSNQSVSVEANPRDVSPPAGRSPHADDVAVACHDSVPAVLGPELDRLYGHIHASLGHYAVARRARHAHAYVARRGAQPVAIFLFERDGRDIVVFNEMMHVAPQEIDRFARYAFARFPSAARIAFSKIGKDVGTPALPWQQYGRSEDVVVTLPATPDAYLSSLSSKTRHNLRHQLKAIAADFPGFVFETCEAGAIADRDVTDLVALKKAATDDKRVQFGISKEEAAWMIERAGTAGLLVVARLDGRVCGGSLSFRLGDHYFAHVNAYDARFAKYSLGMLCCYLAMRESIRRGAKEAHLSRGRNPYKFKLLGVPRELANLDIYRSRLAYCRSFRRVMGNALGDYAARQKSMLLESEQRSGAKPSLLARLVKILRKIKRSTFRAED